jgi:hypothetical protein
LNGCIFPIIACIVISLLLPPVAALIGMLMLGNSSTCDCKADFLSLSGHAGVCQRECRVGGYGAYSHCATPVKERQVVDQLLKNEEFYYVEPKHGQPLLSKIWQLGQDVHNCQVLKISYARHSRWQSS